MDIFATLFRRLPTLLISTLKMTMLLRRCLTLLTSCWNTQHWFHVVQRCKFQRWNTEGCFNVDLTLPHVATSYQPKKNAETTLKFLLGIRQIEMSSDPIKDIDKISKTYWSISKSFLIGKKNSCILPPFENNQYTTDFKKIRNIQLTFCKPVVLNTLPAENENFRFRMHCVNLTTELFV